METKITHWHKMAHLYLQDELSIGEIVKFCIIAESIDLIDKHKDEEDKDLSSFKWHVGYNVFDHSDLNDALVFGAIQNLEPRRKLIYDDLAKILNLTRRIIGLAINRLVENGYLTKEDFGTSGAAYYKTEKLLILPMWVENFTEALVQLNEDKALNDAVTEALKEVGFKRGLQVLQDEIRAKFYRRKK